MVCGYFFPYLSLNKWHFYGPLSLSIFLPFTLTTRSEILKTLHLLSFWNQFRSPVELVSTWFTFSAIATNLTAKDEQGKTKSTSRILETHWIRNKNITSMMQFVKLLHFPPSQASRLTCAICIGWDRGICVIGVAAEAEMVAPAALCCWLAECCTAAASNCACACCSNNCCWAGVNVSYK